MGSKMLPFGAQGSNQAMEVAGALGSLLTGVDNIPLMLERLRLLEIVRIKRASRIQTLSKVRVGQEKQIEDEFKKYLEHHDQSRLACQENLEFC